eukprot:386970-Lingulodinium_polyedra.AAC.1
MEGKQTTTAPHQSPFPPTTPNPLGPDVAARACASRTREETSAPRTISHNHPWTTPGRHRCCSGAP